MHAVDAAELAFERIQKHVALVFDRGSTFLDVRPQIGIEVFGGDHLAERTCAPIGLPGHEPLGDRFGRDKEAETDARTEDLRKRADVHDFARLGQRVDRPLGQRLEADIAVGIVLDDG